MAPSSLHDARQMRLDYVRQPEGWTAYDRPEGGTNITPGDQSPEGEGTRGKRHLCFGRPEGGTTYGSLKSSAFRRISHFDRHVQWVTGYLKHWFFHLNGLFSIISRPYY